MAESQTFLLREIAGVTYLQPDWPVPDHIHSLFTLRSGGVSQPPYDSFNLGDHVGDAPDAVKANRQQLGRVLQGLSLDNGRLRGTEEGCQPVFLNQVHGIDVARWLPEASLENGVCADAVLADRQGQVCVIMVADCLPVLFALPQEGIVAAAHAGWRGLAGVGGRGVLEATFTQMVEAMRAKTANSGTQLSTTDIARRMLVWLGPCIGPAAFEVGNDVRQAFVSAMRPDVPNAIPMPTHCFRPQADTSDKWLADLAALARWRLGLLGVEKIYGNNSTAQWCTVSNAKHYFSHRRDCKSLGASGRMAACVWMTKPAQ